MEKGKKKIRQGNQIMTVLATVIILLSAGISVIRYGKIDIREYENQVRNLRNELREKYPLGNYANTSFTNDRDLLAQAKVERAAYNRELNQGVRRLKRLAAVAKRK